MTSTRDRAVNIFLSLIKDPYYQGSKDKSREEVVWLESQQRARQAQNNEIVLSMAVSDSSGAVKALLRHLTKATTLITIDDDEDAVDDFMDSDAYDQLTDAEKRTYRVAVGKQFLGQSEAGINQRRAIEEITDILSDPDNEIQYPATVTEEPEEDEEEDYVPATSGRRQSRQKYPTGTAYPEEEEKLSPEESLQSFREQVARARAPKTPVTPTTTYTSASGKSITLGAYNLKPTQFLNLEHNPTELEDMSAASDSYGIPIPGKTVKSKRPFIPVRLVNSISTGGHRRFPFNAFIRKLEGDLKNVRDSLTEWLRGDLAQPYHLFGKSEGRILHGNSYSGSSRGEAGFQNYLDDMRNRKTLMEDGSERALADSDIAEHLDNIENIAGNFSAFLDANASLEQPRQLQPGDTRPLSNQESEARAKVLEMATDANKRLTTYGEGIERLKESMADNIYLDVDEDDRAGYRTEKFTPEVSAELLRLQFLEDAAKALGTGVVAKERVDLSYITPFSDFVNSFRFSPDEYNEDEEEKHGQDIKGQHWENKENITRLLTDVIAKYKGQLPPQISSHLQNPDGSTLSIEDWAPTEVSPVEGSTDEADWFTTVTNILTGQRKFSDAVRDEHKSSPRRQSYGGKLRAQLHQLWRASKGLDPVERSGSGKIVDFSEEEIERARRELGADIEGEVAREDTREEEGDVPSRSSEQDRINEAHEGLNTAVSNSELDILDAESDDLDLKQPIDEDLAPRLQDNFAAFFDALMKDDKGDRGKGVNLRDDFVGPDKAFYFNPETEELEWNNKKFESGTTQNLDEIRDLIQDVLMPRNVPEDGEESYTPHFFFTGAASEEVFRRGKVIPTNAELMNRIRQHFAEQLGENVSMNDERIDKIMERLNAFAPGTYGRTYKELLTNQHTKSEIRDIGMPKFLSDIVSPLIEESNTEVSSDLSPDELQEHIASSQAMIRFWSIIERQGDGDINPSLGADIAVAMHPALKRASGTMREKGVDRLEEGDITNKESYRTFVEELKKILSPRTSGGAARREFDAIVSNLATKLLQEMSDKNYDSDNPDMVVWNNPVKDDVPDPILNTIQTALDNPMYGIKALRSNPPSFQNLLQWNMTRRRGYEGWAAENEEQLSFFRELLGDDIFNTWAGQRKFRHIIGEIAGLFPSRTKAEYKHQFGLNENGQIGLEVLPNLYEILKIPASEEEWKAENHETVIGAERFEGGINPYEELRKIRTEGGSNPFAGVVPATMQKIINHFYDFRQPTFEEMGRISSSGISELNPKLAAYQTMRNKITDTAIKDLGLGLEMGVNAEPLIEQIREDLSLIQLNRPFNARGYPINNGSPAHLDDYTSKVLSILKELKTSIEEVGPKGKWISLLGSRRNEEGNLNQRIREIEENYIDAGNVLGEDSWRNQFHRNYWQGWLDDFTLADQNPELQRHIHTMWSDKQLGYQTSVHLNSIFSMEKLLTERGYDQAVKSGDISDEQDLWIAGVIRTVSNSFSDMSKAVNTLGGDTEQQKEQADMFFTTPEGESYQDNQHLPVLVADAAKELQSGVATYMDFDGIFPDMRTKGFKGLDAPIPEAAMNWMKSDKNYGDRQDPSEGEYEPKEKLLSERASGDPESPYFLEPHPDREMDSFERRLLTSRPWSYGTRTPIAEARKLLIDRDPETGNTILEQFKEDGKRWKEYAKEVNPFTDDTSTPPSTERTRNVGPINHQELYDYIGNTPHSYGMIHPYENDYNTEETPHMGADVKAKFNAAGMLDENSQYTPEAHAYMNTLPKGKHESSPVNHMIPQRIADSAINGFQQGFTPTPPQEPGIEGPELNKSWLNKLVIFEGNEEEDDTPKSTNERLMAHPMFQPSTHNEVLRQAFNDDDGNFDDAAFQEWLQTHGLPIHPESPEGNPVIEVPFISARPRGRTGGRLNHHNIHKALLRDIGERSGTEEHKRATLGQLYAAQAVIGDAKNPKTIPTNAGGEAGRPQWEANMDYKLGINRQWISMLENQLIAVQNFDPDDEDAVKDYLEGIDSRPAYDKHPRMAENAFKGYMSRWAAEHGLPADADYDHQSMKDLLGTLTDGYRSSAFPNGRPLYYTEGQHDDGTPIEHFRFRSFPFNREAIHGHFISTHANIFEAHGLSVDEAYDRVMQREAKQTAAPEPEPVPEETDEARTLREEQEKKDALAEARKAADDKGTLRTETYPSGGILVIDSATGETFEDTRNEADKNELPLSPDEIDSTGADDPLIVSSTSPRVTAAKAAAAAKVPAEPKYPKGGHAWNRIRQHLIDTTTMDEDEVDLDMGAMDESDLKAEWQAYSKTRRKTEKAKPTEEGLGDTKRQEYIDEIRAHSHEMHGTDVHGENKFNDMSDKQLSDAYHASHKEMSTHKAKKAASDKQLEANSIVTRLDVLPDGASEDTVLNQARTLTSEYLKNKALYDKPALAHWQTLMQDLKAKAQAAGIDWQTPVSNEINQYQDRFGSPEHLQEVNETKMQQQQQQAEYGGSLDARYAQAQQHPEYRPGHFVTFYQSKEPGDRITPRGHDYNNPIDFGVDQSTLDELGDEAPPMFEDDKGNRSYGMYHPDSESWINPFVYEKARKNLLDKNKNPHLQSTSIIRNGRQWTNTHEYADHEEIDEKHAFAIPTQKKQAELGQRNQSQMGYMIGTDGNIVGLDSDWDGVLNNRNMSQEQSPSRIISDYHIRRLQQQHEQNPDYIGTRREAPMVEPKSQVAQQAQARSQQQPKQEGTALERFTQRQTGKPSAKPYSFNPQDFMSDKEKNLYDYNSFFQDKGAVGRGIGRALMGQNPFSVTPGIQSYWSDRTKEYETQNKVNELYQRMHTQYFGKAPEQPFYGSSKWSKQRASNEALGYDTTGQDQGQGQYGTQPDQFAETQPQTPPVYEEQTQTIPPTQFPRRWLGETSEGK